LDSQTIDSCRNPPLLQIILWRQKNGEIITLDQQFAGATLLNEEVGLEPMMRGQTRLMQMDNSGKLPWRNLFSN